LCVMPFTILVENYIGDRLNPGGRWNFLCLGNHAVSVVSLLPMAILGVLLLFAGSQLALTILDMKERKDLFVSLLMLGITLASNLAVAFIVGFIAAYALKSERLLV
jgi:SulP family sulfate permease